MRTGRLFGVLGGVDVEDVEDGVGAAVGDIGVELGGGGEDRGLRGARGGGGGGRRMAGVSAARAGAKGDKNMPASARARMAWPALGRIVRMVDSYKIKPKLLGYNTLGAT